MRGPHRRRLLSLITATGTAVAVSLFAPAAAADPPKPPPKPVRVKDAPLAEIQRNVIPEGGIKAAMTGGNTVYADVREQRPRADGYRHIDTPRLVSKLREEGLNTYVYGIWDSPTDWDDLRTEFAPAAGRAGIKIWVYVVPPSECLDDPVPHRSGRCSRPYKLDFVSWAREIAKLSLQQPNVVAWAIDDFVAGANSQLFTPEYMQRIVDAQDAVNAKLGFYTTAYYWDATNPWFYDRFTPFIDGIVYPYLGTNTNTQDPWPIGTNLENILKFTEPRGLGLLFLLYTNRFLDAALPPTETYVAQSIVNALPYMRSGRILGINNYGLPLGDKPAITADNRAAHGIGRFNVSLASFAGTRPGDFAQAEQRMRISPLPGNKYLSFADFDGFYGNLGGSGYHIKQLLVDGTVVWESDVTDPGGHTYQQHTVDLTEALKGKHEATIALRIFDRNGVGDYPLDVGFDDVRGDGIFVVNGGFESEAGWRVTGNSSALLPSIDLYAADRPARIREAVATTLRGLPFRNRPYPPEPPTRGYRSDNSAMYGNGRLSFTVPERTTTTAGACASATQVVKVDPNSARYEISFWDYDQYAKSGVVWGHHIKRLLVDGNEVYHHDVADWWENTWMNGESAQGPIDVSQFVRGKDKVTVSFQLCMANPATDLGVDVGIDTIETVGLDIRNPGFETKRDWTLTSSGQNLQAMIRIAG
ncbi:hypothetical protein [Amycolatopsis anabasis]|uniref:hypothetical protein n=1 Tax=Amycolatopsis anabasis TaxID=1840409 RepID=UPI00131D6AC8|nr:hypothetical protein [Amycolatopsis anabasis]